MRLDSVNNKESDSASIFASLREKEAPPPPRDVPDPVPSGEPLRWGLSIGIAVATLVYIFLNWAAVAEPLKSLVRAFAR